MYHLHYRCCMYYMYDMYNLHAVYSAQSVYDVYHMYNVAVCPSVGACSMHQRSGQARRRRGGPFLQRIYRRTTTRRRLSSHRACAEVSCRRLVACARGESYGRGVSSAQHVCSVVVYTCSRPSHMQPGGLTWLAKATASALTLRPGPLGAVVPSRSTDHWCCLH